MRLRKVFDILKSNNISIKSTKSFIEYLTISLLEQHVNSFDLFIDEQKLKKIINLTFFKTLDELKIYLKFIDKFREYIRDYAEKAKSLQERKTQLLINASLIEQVRKSYASKIKFISSTNNEIKFFRDIQSILSKLRF